MPRRPHDFFCDTTILYFKLHGHSLHQQAVRQFAATGRLVLSNFVRGEYIRGYVVGLIELFFAIKEEASVRDGFAVFDADMGNRPRKLAKAHRSTVDWLCGHEDWEDVDKTLRRLGELIRSLLFNLDDEFPTRSRDPLACELGTLAFPRSTYDDNHVYNFYDQFEAILDEPTCRQCEFRNEQHEELSSKRLDLHSAQQRREYSEYKGYVKQAEWIEKALRTRLNRPSCWYCERLADTIIALSAPKEMQILTGDGESFPALGKILGKFVKVIPSVKGMRRKSGARSGPRGTRRGRHPRKGKRK